ncbi:MAG TPA: hypothetical protein HPP76_11540 [Desulfuromonadales bacterium]|nr:hypothetical protein [Desulfuromonadales bacterium]
MIAENICPFYGIDDDQCDVGCGYISPHDVNMIIRYCNGRHHDCLKFHELSERYPQECQDTILLRDAA